LDGKRKTVFFHQNLPNFDKISLEMRTPTKITEERGSDEQERAFRTNWV
jgi:hypothetical protein